MLTGHLQGSSVEMINNLIRCQELTVLSSLTDCILTFTYYSHVLMFYFKKLDS